MLVFNQKLDFPIDWKADEHRKHNTKHRWLLSYLKHVVFWLFYINPLVASASLTHINRVMCCVQIASPDTFVHLYDFWIGISYLTCSNNYLSVCVQWETDTQKY